MDVLKILNAINHRLKSLPDCLSMKIFCSGIDISRRAMSWRSSFWWPAAQAASRELPQRLSAVEVGKDHRHSGSERMRYAVVYLPLPGGGLRKSQVVINGAFRKNVYLFTSISDVASSCTISKKIYRWRMLVRSLSATKDSTCRTISLRNVPIKSLPRRVSSSGQKCLYNENLL